MISFVNPIFLAGLAFAAAPVLLHLLRRDPGRRVTFPPAALLASSAEVLAHRWRPAEILLLALRVLVVAGFVLALARPRLATKGLGAARNVLASAAIVVDDTPSMGAAFRGRGGGATIAGGATRMDEARRAVLEVLERLEPGSRVRLRTASGLLLDEGLDLDEARRLAGTLRPSDAAGSVPNAVADSIAWLKTEPSPRELYVISDFQRSSWPAGEARGPGHGVTVYAVDVGEGGLRDWAVSRVRVAEPRVLRGVLFELKVEVAASSAGTRDLVLELEGKETQRERLRLGAGERTEVAFELAGREPGPVVGVARLVETGRTDKTGEADDWPANDSRAFAVQVQPAAAALCVGAVSGEGALAGGIVSRALAPFAGGERELVRVEEAAPPLPARHDLARHDCVVIAAPSALDEADWAGLGSFVENGGGLLVFADEGVTQKGFLPRTGGLLPAASARVRVSPVRLVSPDYRHPMLRGFEGGGDGRLADIAFRRFVELGGVEEAAGGILARFGAPRGEGRQSPALVEARRGRGRILLFASGPTARWGDLYREPIFVPFVHEAVAVLARSEPAQFSVSAGERLTLKPHPAERGCRARIEDRSVKPPLVRKFAIDAEQLELPLGRLGSRGVFHVVTSGSPGAQAEGRGCGRERAVAVGLDPREFSHERIDPAELFGRRAHLARSVADLVSVLSRSRGGAEVTGYVAWATLAVFLAEMLVAAHLTRRRSALQGQAANVRGAI